MATTTPNFGWPVPTSTDLVKDGATAIEALGDGIDTSMVDLKGGLTGQVLSKTTNADMDFTWVTSDDANAIQNSIVDAKGDLIGASANDTPAILSVGANGETLVADSSTATGLRWQGDYAAGKNKIINGDFGINQRGFTSTTTTTTYGFDRFQYRFTGGTNTYSAQTFTPGAAPVAGYESTNFARIETTGQSAAGDFCYLLQRIEDVRTFAGQTVTFSFWAKASSGTPNVGISFEQSFGVSGSPLVVVNGGVKAITTSWARYSVTVAIPSVSGKTIGTSSLLAAGLFTSAGATLSGAGYPAVGIQNTTIDFWGVQMESGSVATAFQTATGTIQGELAACQRYYIRQGGDTNFQTLATGYGASTTTAVTTMTLPVKMRVAPTSVDFSTIRVHNTSAGYAITAVAIDTNFNSSFQPVATSTIGSASLTIANGYIIGANNSTGGYLGFSAEL